MSSFPAGLAPEPLPLVRGGPSRGPASHLTMRVSPPYLPALQPTAPLQHPEPAGCSCASGATRTPWAQTPHAWSFLPLSSGTQMGEGLSWGPTPGEWEVLLGAKPGEGSAYPSLSTVPKCSPSLLPSIPPKVIQPQGRETWLWLICILSKVFLRSDRGCWKSQADDLTLCPYAASAGVGEGAEDARERSVATVTTIPPGGVTSREPPVFPVCFHGTVLTCLVSMEPKRGPPGEWVTVFPLLTLCPQRPWPQSHSVLPNGLQAWSHFFSVDSTCTAIHVLLQEVPTGGH